ncbi:GNAT family N-acetyltransferase [Bacteroides sp. MSB163]|uniref:GNAT family N-acetyltransferase n=1 Tax=Bacteroides maternus TaxID=3117552 RepID=UPI002EDA8BA4
MNQIILKKTTELAENEMEQVCILFHEIFPKHSMTVESFRNRYFQTPLGYSIHALLKDENNVVIGSHNLVPYYYVFNGVKTLFAYGAGTMIKKEYRNFFTYERLIRESQKYIVENEKCSFLMGFPNANAYPIQKKGLKRKDIGNLSTYILPVRIGSIKKQFRQLNFLSVFFAELWLYFSVLSFSTKISRPLVHKERMSFNKFRYLEKEGKTPKYSFIENKGMHGVYRVMDYEGIKTAFLLDVYPLSKKNFDWAVRTVYKHCSTQFLDMIMYVGYLPFTPMTLIKVPEKLEPKKFHFVGTIFDHDLIDERIFDIENWEVSLADYDLI